MQALVGFKLDFWDYATFATASLAGIAGNTYIHLDCRVAGAHRDRTQAPGRGSGQAIGMGGATAHRTAVDPGIHLGI